MFGPTPYSVKLGGDSHQYVNLWCGISCIWSQRNTKVNRHRADEMLRFLDSAYRAGFDAGAVHAAAKAVPPTDPTLPISTEPRSASYASAVAALTREFPRLSLCRWDQGTVLAYTGPDRMHHAATICKVGRSWDRCSVRRHDAAVAVEVSPPTDEEPTLVTVRCSGCGETIPDPVRMSVAASAKPVFCDRCDS